ncbi:MAG: polysaccharide biosynthesis tyrosine autokinase [Erysipelotrichaceae bacterium]|nr:polysaccharide biosynthesis tyrosine autokinase [Erysipelotrichaceae bacterium]
MSTYENTGTLEKIDITSMLFSIWNSVKKIWYVFVLLPFILAVLNYFRVSTTYSPTYTAESTISISVVGTDGTATNNARTADQLGKVFPYIFTSSAMKDIIANDLGMSYVPGNITVQNVSGTNLLTIRVTGSDPELVYKVLQSAIVTYPEISQHVVGRTAVEVIDDSGVPTDSGKRGAAKGSVIAGAVAGVILSVIILIIYMLTFRTVLNARDIRSITSVPYLGTLPVYRKRKRRKSDANGINILRDNTQHDYLEAIRVIRTRLSRNLKSNTALMVTSSLPGEGKSTVSVNLALAFAMQNKKVALIDCDLRNPSVMEVLNMKGDYPGIAEVLAGNCELEDTLISYSNKGTEMMILPGTPPTGADHPELLRSKKMRQIINTIKKQVDIVVLDTPPSAMLADAEMVVRHADAAVYVVMCDYARSQYVQKGISELAETGIDIKGVILNAGKEASSSGYGGYGYGYYGSKSSSYYGSEDAER